MLIKNLMDQIYEDLVGEDVERAHQAKTTWKYLLDETYIDNSFKQFLGKSEKYMEKMWAGGEIYKLKHKTNTEILNEVNNVLSQTEGVSNG